MDGMSSLRLILYKIKFQKEFLKHSKSENHIISKEDKKLRKIIMQNYYKSFFIFNILAVYLNYLRKNKSFMKTVISNNY